MKARTFYTAALVSACALSGVSIAQAMQDSKPVPFRIDAPSMTEALLQFTQQSHLQLAYSGEKPLALKAPKVEGKLTPQAALDQLLKGSGLQYEFVNDRTVSIRRSEPEHTQSHSTTSINGGAGSIRIAQADITGLAVDTVGGGSDSSSTTESSKGIEQITVTGTYIHGAAPPASSVRVYTRDAITQSGAGTIDQFARTMSENFSNADSVSNINSNANFAAFAGNGSNAFNGSAFNLHGLGTTSTLTLLNGHRIAAGGLDGGITDVSQIPLSIVDRIEVLADGASALYGADAVAGVVNIVTRKDFSGAETSVRYGSSDGGAAERTAAQTLGTSWNSGNAFINYEYHAQDDLDASRRDFIGDQGGPYGLIPQSRLNSVFLAATQTLAPNTVLRGDASYAKRRFSQPTTTSGTDYLDLANTSGDVKQSGVSLVLEQTFADDWHAQLTGTHSKIEQTADSAISHTDSFGGFDITSRNAANASISGADLLVDGSALTTRAGDIRVAVGASYHKEKFDSATLTDFAGTTFVSDVPGLDRNVRSLYTEFLIPLVNSNSGVRGAHRLELSAAARYDHYSDFGSTTNPKFGLAWEPAQGFAMRATYGKSFQAPLLSQLGSPVLDSTAPMLDSSSPEGVSNAVVISGGNPLLGPQRSRSWTVGFDVKPDLLRPLLVGMTYFRTRYEDRISIPPSSSGGLNDLGDPLLAPFIVRSPDLSTVQALFNSPGFLGDSIGLGPQGIQAIFDQRYSNIAATKQSGIDASFEYTLPLATGYWDGSLRVTRLLHNDFQTASTAPFFSLVNQFGQPSKWRGRAGLSWAHAGFLASATVSYVSSYVNALQVPAQSVGAWTTTDLFFSYKTGAEQAPLIRDLTLTLGINNVMDREPPHVEVPVAIPGQNPIPFDPANASPLGRFVTFGVTKHW